MAIVSYCPITGVFRRLKKTNRNAANSVAGNVNYAGYVTFGLIGKTRKAHQLAWLYMTGKWPHNQIDHQNRNRSDNRWSNLRIADFSKNQANAKKRTDNVSGTTGVHFAKREQKWMAFISKNGKRFHVGYFQSKSDAIAARKVAQMRVFGEFARAA